VKKLNEILTRIPPNWEECIAHQSANNIGDEVDISESCPCCNRKIERKQLSIGFTPKDISFLGAGYPLYFVYLKYCVFILLLTFMTSGAFNLLSNILSGKNCLTS